MMEKSSPDIPVKKFFNEQELLTLSSFEASSLKEVYCYLWMNNISKPSVEMLIAAELVTNKGNLFISIHDTDEALEINKFDYQMICRQLKDEFGNKIKLFRIPASDTGMWKDCSGKKLLHVKLTRQDNQYLSDSMILQFEDEMRIIKASPLDGLIIDFYEDDI